MSWNPLDDPVDYFTLGGRRSAGIAAISGAGSPRKWEERGGYGMEGSILFYTGNGLAKPVAKLLLSSTKDWNDWHAFKEVVKRPPNNRYPKALDIWHPYLEDLEIKSVVVKNVSQPEPVGEEGAFIITIEFMQYRRRKIALVKSEGSQATPTDPVDQQIDALTKQVEALL